MRGAIVDDIAMAVNAIDAISLCATRQPPPVRNGGYGCTLSPRPARLGIVIVVVVVVGAADECFLRAMLVGGHELGKELRRLPAYWAVR